MKVGTEMNHRHIYVLCNNGICKSAVAKVVKLQNSEVVCEKLAVTE